MKKTFLVFVTLLITAALFAGPGAESETSDAGGVVPAGEFNEAPMLAALVKSGDLPPVAERLPVNPMVGDVMIAPEWRETTIGNYGGTLRLTGDRPEEADGGGDIGWMLMEYYISGPWKFPKEAFTYPNVFQAFYSSADYKTITFEMREGMKWSNGEDFNTEDIRFWFDDVITNKELFPVLPVFLKSPARIEAEGSPTGTPCTLDIIDDYTFAFVFDVGYPKFLGIFRYNCSLWAFSHYFPSDEYFKQFHPTYADPDELAAKVKDAGFEPGEWTKLFMAERGSPEQPVMNPFILKDSATTYRLFERNPYYFKVDEAGNQLPYFDYIKVSIVADMDAAALKVVAGEVDYGKGVTGVLKNVELIREYEDANNYTVIDTTTGRGSPAEVVFNLTNPDPDWQQVVRDVRFRYALSLAINRQKIIDIVYDGMAGMPNLIDHGEYDVAKANEILDSLGLERDRNGYRTLDGERIVIPFEVNNIASMNIDTAEIVAGEWAKIGITANVKAYEEQYYYELAEANKLFVTTNSFAYKNWPSMGRDYLGGLVGRQAATWGLEWYKYWMTKDNDVPDGEYPPPEYWRMWDLEGQERYSFDPEVKRVAWENLRGWLTDQYYWLSLVDDVPEPTFASNELGNVPIGGWSVWAQSSAETMYFK